MAQPMNIMCHLSFKVAWNKENPKYGKRFMITDDGLPWRVRETMKVIEALLKDFEFSIQ